MWDGFVAHRATPLSGHELAQFAHKRVLITGAGGYLGSALVRALSQVRVGLLVLLDTAEYGLYRLLQDLDDAVPRPEMIFTVGSVCDKALLRELFSLHAPELIFHAAALKHVPLMEANPLAAAEINVLGTQALIEVATERQVERFVQLSTDKAVEPISVMGATKRIAEQIVLSARDRNNGGFKVVRLCNVLGSTGSVAPLFASQIAQGGPVTVTHSEATRYFLSRSDAVRHLLRAAITLTPTGLVIPVVGKPLRVVDLARYMMGQIGNGTGSSKIVYTGLRTADKLHEQLASSSESVGLPSEGSHFLNISTGFDGAKLEQALAQIQLAVSTRDRDRLMRAIQGAVPEYLDPQRASPQKIGVGA